MRYLQLITLTILVVSMLSGLVAQAALPEPESMGNEMSSGYMTVVDERGTVVLQTGHQVHPGDAYINEENIIYEITAVEGTLARARAIESPTTGLTPRADFPVQAPPPDVPKPLIAVYHSHTDESYIPSDGTATQRGKGSIMLVGQAFTDKLSEIGYQVDHDITLHDPHDANAYQRSRRTVMRLLQKQPAAIFDVHRDSAPLSAYKATINGQDVSKIIIVVGRQNQNRQTTQSYAQSIKAAADAKYKGLIRGIFIAHGNYNQDLSPRAILIEVGTQYNSREAAERSIALFADVVPSFLESGGSVAQASPADNTGHSAGTFPASSLAPGYDLLWMALVLIVGSAAYLYLSTGSWQEAKNKLKQFAKYEFTNFLGPRKKPKK